MNTIFVLVNLLTIFVCSYALASTNRSFLAQSKKYHWLTKEAYLPTLDPYFLALIWFVMVPIFLLPVFQLRSPHYYDAVLAGLLNYTILLFLYYLLLWSVLPLLHRWFKTETCTMLFSLPIFLVILVLFGDGGLPNHPLLVIRLPLALPSFLKALWALGFFTVLGWKLLSHLLYRRKLLRRAEEVSSAVQKLQYETACSMGVDQRIPLLISPDAKGPLAVGVLPSKVSIVLPQMSYSDEELRLILRHEMVHLIHKDNVVKVCLTVLTSLFWFLPPVWMGLSKAAQEIELNCDELAAGPLSEDERRQYAGLLLVRPQPATGFTTCLSASARGLRYRMERILHPKKRRNEKILVILILILIVTAFGRICFSYPVGSIREEILDGADYELEYGVVAEDFAPYKGSYFQRPISQRACLNREALKDYLDSFTLYKQQSGYMNQNDYKHPYDLGLTISGPGENSFGTQQDLWFRGDRLYIVRKTDSLFYRDVYQLSKTPDYDYIRSLLGEPVEAGPEQKENRGIFR